MREEILDAAERMVQDRGFNAVSFQQIADEVGLKKPSIFHHFKNKAALALALVQRCQSKYGPFYGEIIEQQSGAPEKLRAVALSYAKDLLENRLCLLAALGNGSSSLPELAQEELRISANATIDRFSKIFKQGRKDQSLVFGGEPEAAATAFLAMLQGLQVLARTKQQSDVFEKAVESYISALRP